MASFTSSVEEAIRTEYQGHCAICLTRLPGVGVQSAHLIDSALLLTAVHLGLLSTEYKRNSVINGIGLCPTCHLAYFTPNFIALSPPAPVLRYIFQYLVKTPAGERKPLHQVFKLLRLAMAGENVALPDPTSILPYLGLFTIVILRPEAVVGTCITTQHLPPLSILQEGHFVPAPSATSSTDQNAARIFDVIAVSTAHPPLSLGPITLSSEDPEFLHRRYWRVPVLIEAVLAVLMERVGNRPSDCEEIRWTQTISGVLHIQRYGMSVSLADSGSGSGDGPRGGGWSRCESGMLKRDLQIGDHNEPPHKKGQTKGGSHEALDEAGVSKSCSVERDETELSDRSVSPERTHHGVDPEQWEVASSFSAIVDEERLRMRSPSQNSAASTTISRAAFSEDGPDDPDTWQFGPSYRSDVIIVTARGISLV